MKLAIQCLAAAAIACAAAAANAHVVLPAGGAPAGSRYEAAFTVGHACSGSQATTALAVELPQGFELLQAQPRPGWTLSAPPAGSQGGEVRWTAESPAAALPGHEKAVFTVSGVLPATPGTLYFPVRQVCDQGQADWVQLPGPGGEKPKMPAARLEVLAPTAPGAQASPAPASAAHHHH